MEDAWAIFCFVSASWIAAVRQGITDVVIRRITQHSSRHDQQFRTGEGGDENES